MFVHGYPYTQLLSYRKLPQLIVVQKLYYFNRSTKKYSENNIYDTIHFVRKKIRITTLHVRLGCVSWIFACSLNRLTMV